MFVLCTYIVSSIVLYFIYTLIYNKLGNPFFEPKSSVVYYILSFTWGLPTTLLGLLVAAVLCIFGYRPKLLDRNIVFLLDVDFGLSLGIVCVLPNEHMPEIYCHEHGHSIQNLMLGLYMPTVVCIPSCVRYWYRTIRAKIGKPCKSLYEDVWFEGSASIAGVNSLGKLDKTDYDKLFLTKND